MLARLLRAAALVASGIVILSFGLFALDETRAASQRTTAEIAGLRASRSADPDPAQERARERVHTDVRELIDDGNDILVAPFAFAAPDGGDRWAQRGLPALLALAVYGFCVPFLARWLQSHG